MNIISGSSNTKLAQDLVKTLQETNPQISLIDCQIEKFANDEKKIWIKDENKVHGQKVCLVQSFSKPVDENIIETLLIIDALERLGAKEISIIIPWMGYSFQDKVFRDGEAIAAKVVASLMSSKLITRVFLLDLHNDSIPGFFSVSTYHLSARNLFIDYLKNNNLLENASVVSPDFGGLKRARVFANQLNLPLLNIDKSRDLYTGEVTANGLHGGEIKGKNAIVFDDAIMSGSTVVKTAELLKKEGASKVIFIATHGIFCKNGIETINQSEVDLVLIGDSILQKETSNKIKYVQLAPLFAAGLADWI